MAENKYTIEITTPIELSDAELENVAEEVDDLVCSHPTGSTPPGIDPAEENDDAYEQHYSGHSVTAKRGG
jgi:hypothetical protein